MASWHGSLSRGFRRGIPILLFSYLDHLTFFWPCCRRWLTRRSLRRPSIRQRAKNPRRIESLTCTTCRAERRLPCSNEEWYSHSWEFGMHLYSINPRSSAGIMRSVIHYSLESPMGNDYHWRNSQMRHTFPSSCPGVFFLQVLSIV